MKRLLFICLFCCVTPLMHAVDLAIVNKHRWNIQVTVVATFADGTQGTYQSAELPGVLTASGGKIKNSYEANEFVLGIDEYILLLAAPYTKLEVTVSVKGIEKKGMFSFDCDADEKRRVLHIGRAVEGSSEPVACVIFDQEKWGL